MKSRSSCTVRNTTLVRQSKACSLDAASNPLRIGIEMSMTKISGSSRPTSITASRPLFTVPTISKSSPRTPRTPRQNGFMIVGEQHSNFAHMLHIAHVCPFFAMLLGLKTVTSDSRGAPHPCQGSPIIMLLRKDDCVLHRVLNKSRIRLDSQFFHDPILVEADGST